MNLRIFVLGFVLVALQANAMNSNIWKCGGSNNSVEGQTIELMLQKNDSDTYELRLNRSGPKVESPISDYYILDGLTCRFSEKDEVVTSCSGGSRMGPKMLRVDRISTLNVYGEEVYYDIHINSPDLNIDLKKTKLDVFARGRKSDDLIAKNKLNLQFGGTDYGCQKIE